MLLELSNISKQFAVKKGFLGQTTGFVRAVDRVNLTVKKGENLSLVGESGSGKTTLARVILKLYMPDTGNIVFEGREVTKAKGNTLRDYRKNVQIVFQDPYSSLDPRFTVRSILKEAMTLDPSAYKTHAAKEDRMQELIKAVQLPVQVLNRYPHEFSGGERQRIAIARALVLKPKLLILDEAVSSLDVIIQEQILKLLKDLQQRFDLTYLFISHNLKVVRKTSQRIAVMFQGRIVELAGNQQIFDRPLHPYTQRLLKAAIEYKSDSQDVPINVPSHAAWKDHGDGHWVMTE